MRQKCKVLHDERPDLGGISFFGPDAHLTQGATGMHSPENEWLSLMTDANAKQFPTLDVSRSQ
jgi:hypothetical protein